ncbi:unnamed protein product [Musa acuminata var. zebrina]
MNEGRGWVPLSAVGRKERAVYINQLLEARSKEGILLSRRRKNCDGCSQDLRQQVGSDCQTSLWKNTYHTYN